VRYRSDGCPFGSQLALGGASTVVDDRTKRLRDLCERASEEQDRERQQELTKKIEQLLGEIRIKKNDSGRDNRGDFLVE
jgi:hypothetical protein